MLNREYKEKENELDKLYKYIETEVEDEQISNIVKLIVELELDLEKECNQ